MTHEIWWRLGCFFCILFILMLIEAYNPARKSPIKNSQRWAANYGLVFASTIIARITLPIGLTAVALYHQQYQIGLFNQLSYFTSADIPKWAIILCSLLVLDIIIYWQHRLFHQIPLLWRFHRVHHADVHIDTSTGLSFHPVEILASIVIKLLVITLLGVPALAVLIFEITLNGLALFNHANIRLPRFIEKYVRLFLITQMLHRIHHSQVAHETNSNYGFSVVWWDKLFGSYKANALKNDNNLDIGLKEYTNTKQNASFLDLLFMPFKK